MSAIPVSEQDAVTLKQYIQYLQSELERTQALLCQHEMPALAASITSATGTTDPDADESPAHMGQPQTEISYRAVVEEQFDVICRFRPDFRLTYVNGPYAELYGKRPEELLGHSLLEIVLPEYQAQVIAHLFSLTAERPMAVEENPVRLADGSVRWFHWTNRLIEHRAGVIEYQAVGRDITDRKQAEDAERKQRQLAEAMRDSLAALTSLLDVEQVMVQILASAATVVPSEAGSIILVKNGYGRVAYSRGFKPEITTALQQSPFAIEPLLNLRKALAHKEPYLIADTHTSAEWIAFPLTNWIRSSIGVPIECNGQMIGLLIADSAIPHFFEAADIEKLQAFAYYAGLALNNAYHATMLEQRVAERTSELQASEAKFRQLLAVAPVAIVISNQAGQIVLVNNQTELLFGYQSVELVQQPIEILLSEAARGAHVEKRQAYVANLQTREMGRGLELVARRKDGSHFPVEIQLSYSETRDGLLVVSFILDITERKRAADDLRKQRDFLQLVIDKIPSFIAVNDRQGYFQLVNQYTAQLFGTTPDLLVGTTMAAMNINPAELQLLYQATEDVLTRKQALFVPEQEIAGLYVEANLIPLLGIASEEEQVLIVATNITERKQAELALRQAFKAEQEMSELKSSFITTTSHEFRTPLAIILSMTETLRAYRHKLTDEQIEQRLGRIMIQVHHLKAMLDDAFDLARMQVRRVTFKPVLCDPMLLCRDLITELQNQFESTRQLCYTYEADLPLAHLDERLLRQILSNLIANAINYSAAPKPISIHLGYDGAALLLTVRDEGIGIPAADMKHLFLPFYRATNVGTVTGAGLGLSIAREAAVLHGGLITAESQVDVGSTFTVRIPLVPPSN